MGEGNGIAARVDGGRLWRRLMEMAEIGAIPGNGVNRQALSDEDIAARELLVDWARRRGYAVAVDDAANLFVRRPGGDPSLAPVLTGSHMDSQPRGGRFDGIYGVIAGLEAIEAIDDAGAATRRPIELVAWTNEEGSRFDPGCMGSMVFSGTAPLERFEDAIDANGISFGRALARTLSAAPDLPRRNGAAPPAAYVEAHIEQGPVLEAASVPIGAVTGVQGSQRFVVEIGGATAHAGTTPVRGRRDALQAALRAVARLNEAMTDSNDVLRFTVGRFEVTPNSPQHGAVEGGVLDQPASPQRRGARPPRAAHRPGLRTRRPALRGADQPDLRPEARCLRAGHRRADRKKRRHGRPAVAPHPLGRQPRCRLRRQSEPDGDDLHPLPARHQPPRERIRLARGLRGGREGARRNPVRARRPLR